MLPLKKTANSLIHLNLTKIGFKFSGDNWKNRDEASQKVYITQAEKQTIKRLLKKVEYDSNEQLQTNRKFEEKLKEILKKHNVSNEAFFSQVSNLHKIHSD